MGGLERDILNKMLEIRQLFQGEGFACILTPSGKILVSNENPKNADLLINSDMIPDLERSAVTLRSSAKKFAQILSESHTSSIHVKGKLTLFSCYDIGCHTGEFYLAFYTKFKYEEELDQFETVNVDNDMEVVLVELGDLCNELIAQRTPKHKK